MIVTLLTDFGDADTYVGQMKGRILRDAPSTVLVDLTHRVPAGSIEVGARLLQNAVRVFPTGTIHLAVVDPGVGTARKGLVVAWRGHLFVGPDNGLFTPFLRDGALAGEISSRFMEARHGHTFHGRDFFAPAAAALASGSVFEDVIEDVVTRPVLLDLSEPEERDGALVGRVWHVDSFGNLITDVPVQALEGRSVVEIAGRRLSPIFDTFASVPPGTLVAYRGSFGYLEIAEYMGSAAKTLGAGRDTEVVVR